MNARCCLSSGMLPERPTQARSRDRIKDFYEDKAGDKAADVGPEGNASHVPGRESCREQLHEEPEPEEDESRDLYKLEKEEDRYQCQDSGTGIEKEIGPHDSGDGPTRSDGRDVRIPIGEEMDQTGRHTAEEIEGEISKVAEPVFNIVPEDIEKPHVHDNVKEPSVKKHGGQEREILSETGKVSSQFRAGVSEGHDSVSIEHFFQIRTLEEFPQKDNDV